MYDIFAGLFDFTLLTFKLQAAPDRSVARIIAYCTFNTLIRAALLGSFLYGAIRVVITAVSHGSF